ncbi:phage tail protein [Spartinivicinus ruber]|uniref:phage tail protein n=1 Tax=Spartinivicinus ruber TaxID=2683272 RepID=UPI0013D87710|nr:phage tail protein [Spartinivicinus ruber]
MPVITHAGERLIAEKQGMQSPLIIKHFVLANVPDLTDTDPENRHELLPSDDLIQYQAPVTQAGFINPNAVVYSLVMDTRIGDFEFNWLGLVAEDNTLVAVSYVPKQWKRKTQGSQAGNSLTRNFMLAFSGAQDITQIDVNADTWQIDFSARLNGIDERQRLANLDLYGHDVFFSDGFKVIRQDAHYLITAGVGYVGGVRVTTEKHLIKVTEQPSAIWVDVCQQGSVTSNIETVVAFNVVAELSDYVDRFERPHWVAKLAEINSQGEVIDTRRVTDGFAEHFISDNPHNQYLTKALALQLPIMPEVLTPTNRLAVIIEHQQLTIVKNQVIRWRGWQDFNTSGYSENQRQFFIDSDKTYHLRWSPLGGFDLKDLNDTPYNPNSLVEYDLSFDTTYDDVLLGKIEAGDYYPSIIATKRLYRPKISGNGTLWLPLGYRDRSFRLLVTIRNQLQQGNVLFKSVDKAHTALFTMRGNNHGDNMNVELDSDDEFWLTSNNSNGEVSISTLTGDIIDDLLYMQNHQSEYVKKIQPGNTIDGDEELFSMGIKRLTTEDVQKGLPLDYANIESASIVFEVF